MRNPLNKRYIRELKSDFGKYLVIFAFMVLFAGAMSGFFITGESVMKLYEKSHKELNLEDGHMAFNYVPEENVLKQIEEDNQLKLYPLFYKEETILEKENTIRVYMDRDQVNLVSLLDGIMPDTEDEIALDRLYAENNNLSIGDKVTLKDQKYKITALIALPDYSALYQNNNDIMFDSINFGIAIMNKDGYQRLESNHETYNYAWLYNEKPLDEYEENERFEDLKISLEDIITEYDKEIIGAKDDPLGLLDNEELSDLMEALGNYLGIEEENDDLLVIEDCLPRYVNQAIIFVGTDGESDRASAQMMTYIINGIIAFLFAVTVSNTILREAASIGTLRALGYSKGELIRHYMFLPLLITILGCGIGNILGYTIFTNMFKGVYYSNYSLPNYEAAFNANAFIQTTIIPLILVIIINLFVLVRKLSLKPIDFLRGELNPSRKQRTNIRLSQKIPFMTRFRLRILFQNIPSYLVLSFGIFIAGVLAVFGFMFLPLLQDYSKLITETKICEYQYVLMDQVETENKQAEKYALNTLTTVREGYLSDDVSVFGVEEDSKYITKDIPKGKILISNAAATKYNIKQGDTFIAEAKYENKTYTFIVADEYVYDAGIAVFMNKEDYIDLFEEDEDYFAGYFSNEILDDIDEDDIATIVDTEALSKLSTQMTASFGSFMLIFQVIGAMIFILLMFVLTKQIIERNIKSISMTKILGFTNWEIARLYLVITSFVVIAALLLSVPIIDMALRFIMSSYMYKRISGYIPYIVSNSCYIKTIVMGILCYLFVGAGMVIKIMRLPKGKVLKNQGL